MGKKQIVSSMGNTKVNKKSKKDYNAERKKYGIKEKNWLADNKIDYSKELKNGDFLVDIIVCFLFEYEKNKSKNIGVSNEKSEELYKKLKNRISESRCYIDNGWEKFKNSVSALQIDNYCEKETNY